MPTVQALRPRIKKTYRLWVRRFVCLLTIHHPAERGRQIHQKYLAEGYGRLSMPLLGSTPLWWLIGAGSGYFRKKSVVEPKDR